jgi:hypothetical protein
MNSNERWFSYLENCCWQLADGYFVTQVKVVKVSSHMRVPTPPGAQRDAGNEVRIEAACDASLFTVSTAACDPLVTATGDSHW